MSDRTISATIACDKHLDGMPTFQVGQTVCKACLETLLKDASAIPALVEALQETKRAMINLAGSLVDLEIIRPAEKVEPFIAGVTVAYDKARAALALVKPPPTVQAAKSTPILDAIKTVREQELHRAAQAEAAMANDPDLEGHIEEEEP